MRKLIFALCAVWFTGCMESPPPLPPASKIETENLIYLSASSVYNVDIIVLNDWLRANPDKKFVSLAGVYAGGSGGVDGYVARFDHADNSRQRCTRLFARESEIWRSRGGFGIEDLDKWMIDHRTTKNLIIVSIPNADGGALSHTLCFDNE